MKWNHLAAAAAISVVGMLSGCASVQKADRNASDHAKVFSPLTDKAVVYVYRDELLGAAIKMPVKVDGVLAGQTGPKSFLQLALAPGHHTISSLSEKDTSLAIDVESGKAYYVWQEVKMGVMSARSALHLVSSDVGQIGVRKCDLLQTEAPALRISQDAGAVTNASVMPVTLAPATSTPTADTSMTASADAVPAPTADAPEATSVTATPPAHAVQSAVATSAEGGLAVLDARVDKAVFVSAQAVASRHQCERLLRVRSVNGTDAHLYSACPGTPTPIEIACTGNHCEEAAPRG